MSHLQHKLLLIAIRALNIIIIYYRQFVKTIEKSDKLKTGKFVVVKNTLKSLLMFHKNAAAPLWYRRVIINTFIYQTHSIRASRRRWSIPFTLIPSAKAAALNVCSAILHHIAILLRFRKCNKWKQTEAASCRLQNFDISFLNIENPFLRPSHGLEDKEGHFIKDLASVSTPATSCTSH